MNTDTAVSIRTQLLERKHRLRDVVSEIRNADDLMTLLRAVDEALERLDGGRYGSCDVCHEDVDDDELLAHPLIQYCLCRLTEQQQAALQHDLDMARRVQLALLPKQNLSAAGWEVHFRYQPAGPVSGDYLDVIAGKNGADGLYLMLGDVSGKGVAASLLMAQLNALLRNLAATGPSPAELLDQADRFFRDSGITSHFATLVCTRATPDGRIDICNAGHCPPIIAGVRGVEMVDGGGFPVGLGAGGYEVCSRSLSGGEMMVLYSDGLTETFNEAGLPYGVERLQEALRRHADQAPAQLAAACLADLAEFQGGEPRHDDLSLMVVRRTA